MALIKCESCGCQVSDLAEKCPKCGNVINGGIAKKDKQNVINEKPRKHSEIKHKKKYLFVAIAVVAVIILSVLIALVVPNNETKNGETNNPTADFVVDKVLYECDEFILTCKTIKKDGIEFKCENETSEELTVHLVVSLDGVTAPLWASSNENTIKPNETKTFLENGTIENTEHKYMSVDGTVFFENDSVSFEVCNMELNGNENPAEVLSGKSIYESKNLNVEFIEANAQGLKFKVENNRTKSITFGADSLTINEETQDYAMTVVTVPPCSIGYYNVDILSYNEDYFASDLISFEGIFKANVNGEGEVDRFEVNYSMDSSNQKDNEQQTSNATQDNNSTNETLELGVVEHIKTAAEIPDTLMNNEFKNIVSLFSKGYSESGLNISNAESFDGGETNIFYLEGLEFLGKEPEGGYFSPRIIYSKEAINNNGTPNMIYLAFSYPRKSNGYEETVEIVEDIAKALGITSEGLIDNDYSSSSKWATGKYATFTFTQLNLELTVSNMQSSVEIEIVPTE